MVNEHIISIFKDPDIAKNLNDRYVVVPAVKIKNSNVVEMRSVTYIDNLIDGSTIYTDIADKKSLKLSKG